MLIKSHCEKDNIFLWTHADWGARVQGILLGKAPHNTIPSYVVVDDGRVSNRRDRASRDLLSDYGYSGL